MQTGAIEFADRVIFPIQPGNSTLGTWKRTHDYDVWTECRPRTEAPLTLWQAHGRGVVRIPDNDHVMHIIPGGVAHHIERLFGYWRACDSDIVWLRVARGEWVHYAMVLGGNPSAYEKDAILWICPSCANVIGREEVLTGRKQVAKFWPAERNAVAAFNASEAARTCGKCGRIHPPAYAFRKFTADSPASEGEW